MPVDASHLSARARAGYFAANLFVRGLLGAVLLIPYRWRVPFMGWGVSRVASPLAGLKTRIRKNLALTHPDMPEDQIRHLCRAVPDNAGRTLIEIYSPKEFKARVCDAPIEGPGLAAFEAAQAQGKPVLLAPSHFGNYNAMRANLQGRGHNVAALYRRMANPYFNEHYIHAMQETGAQMFEQGPQGMRHLVKHLKSGGIVAILHDLHVQAGRELTFFGQPALTSVVMAELALKYGADIIPCYSIRQPNGLDFKLVMTAPIPASDPETMTQALNDDLEKMVRANMEQWFWIHRRWKPFNGKGHPEGGA